MADTCTFCGRELPVEHKAFCGRTFEITRDCDCTQSVEAREFAARELQAERFRHALDTRLKTASVPSKFREVPAIPTYRKQLRAGRWLYISGSVGAGKTTQAAIALKDYLSATAKQDMDGLFFDFVPAKWLSAKETIRRAYDNDSDIAEVIGPAKIVVLDDLGKGKPTEWFIEKLFELVDWLYSEGRTVIITSQYPLDRLASRLSQGDPDTAAAIVSRLRERSNLIDAGDKDRRQTA